METQSHFDGLKKAIAKVKRDLSALREKRTELEEELAEERASAEHASQTRSRASSGSTSETARLRDEVRRLKAVSG